jgi:hypothetical protein
MLIQPSVFAVIRATYRTSDSFVAFLRNIANYKQAKNIVRKMDPFYYC